MLKKIFKKMISHLEKLVSPIVEKLEKIGEALKENKTSPAMEDEPKVLVYDSYDTSFRVLNRMLEDGLLEENTMAHINFDVEIDSKKFHKLANKQPMYNVIAEFSQWIDILADSRLKYKFIEFEYEGATVVCKLVYSNIVNEETTKIETSVVLSDISVNGDKSVQKQIIKDIKDTIKNLIPIDFDHEDKNKRESNEEIGKEFFEELEEEES